MQATGGDVLQDIWPFYFTSSPPPSLCSIKETTILTLIKRYSRTLVCHLLGCPAFQIKSYSLPHHLITDLLACRATSRVSLEPLTLCAVLLLFTGLFVYFHRYLTQLVRTQHAYLWLFESGIMLILESPRFYLCDDIKTCFFLLFFLTAFFSLSSLLSSSCFSPS